MTKGEEIEQYLIENKIEYFKNDVGFISVDINKIPKDKFKAYHNTLIEIQRGISLN